MNACAICGSGKRRAKVCDLCLETVDGLQQYHAADLIVVTDASCQDGQMFSGGGIVVARRDERVLATIPVELYECYSHEAEYETMRKAMMLAPGVPIWGDNANAIGRIIAESTHYTDRSRFDNNCLPARWLPDNWRYPLHDLTHNIATCARRRDWHRYNRLTVPRRAA